MISKRFERPALAFKKNTVNTAADAPISATPGGIKPLSGVAQPDSTHLESRDYHSVSTASPCRLQSVHAGSLEMEEMDVESPALSKSHRKRV